MQVEQQLRRVKPYRSDNLVAEYWFLKPLYLEHLLALHAALDSTLEAHRKRNAEKLAYWEDAQQQSRASNAEDDFEWMVSTFRTMPVLMKNEEFHFTEMAQVAALNRKGFREFYMSAHDVPNKATISFSATTVRVEVSEKLWNAQDTFIEIDRILRSRRGLLSWIWTSPKHVLTGAVLVSAVGVLVNFTSMSDVIKAIISGCAASLVVLFGIAMPLLLAQRKRVVVNRYSADSEPWWDKQGPQTLTAAAMVILTIVGFVWF